MQDWPCLKALKGTFVKVQVHPSAKSGWVCRNPGTALKAVSATCFGILAGRISIDSLSDMVSCKQSTRSLAQQYCTPRPKVQPFSQVGFGIFKACEPPRKAEFSIWKTPEPVGTSVQRSGPFCDNHQHTQCSETLSSVPLPSLSDR